MCSLRLSAASPPVELCESPPRQRPEGAGVLHGEGAEEPGGRAFGREGGILWLFGLEALPILRCQELGGAALVQRGGAHRAGEAGVDHEHLASGRVAEDDHVGPVV